MHYMIYCILKIVHHAISKVICIVFDIFASYGNQVPRTNFRLTARSAGKVMALCRVYSRTLEFCNSQLRHRNTSSLFPKVLVSHLLDTLSLLLYFGNP